MPTFGHILFPVDFSEQNCGIAPYVANIARQYRARLTILHATPISVPPYPGWPAYGPVVNVQLTEEMMEQWQEGVQAMVEQTHERLDSFLTTEFRGIVTTRLVQEGDPAHLIVEFVAKAGVDLIMMPTHGYGPFRRFLLGSVTAKVLHDAKCAVWTSAHRPAPLRPQAAYRNVLCAIDLTPKGLALLLWASEFARQLEATLKLVHAIPGAETRPGVDIEGGKWRQFLFDVAGEELAKLQRKAGTNWGTVIEGGSVEHVVRRAAEENHADLVVIGRGVIHETLGRMRTHVYSIVREAPCPVVSV